ncbi:MAG: hypothetical protein QGG89_02995, partial [Vicinamibacterales bacterium]|nr:hypothetical protein [Vicinamibacterales bacterium]
MRRVLLIASKTGYQTRAFGEAAERAGVELVFVTDRCRQLDNPWRDGAIPVRFYDEAAFLEAIGAVARQQPFDGVLGVGDRPALFAALAADALGLRGHPPHAARVSGNKLETRRCLVSAGLPCPDFHDVALDGDVDLRQLVVELLQPEVDELTRAEFDVRIPYEKMVQGDATIDGVRAVVHQLLRD